MATAESTLSGIPDNIDLIRRYCPSLAVHTHEQVAAHVMLDANGCWPWDGPLNQKGYATLTCQPTRYGCPQSVEAHRYFYDTLVGPIPRGYYVHHRCEYKACWHPLHLQAMTPRDHLIYHGLIPAPKTFMWDERGQLLLFHP